MAKTVLFISPDYVSHFNPLIPIGAAFQMAGYRVVVATGPSLAQHAQQQDFYYEELILGEESNTGLIRPQRQKDIQASLQATKRSWIAALMEQADSRVRSFLWHGSEVAQQTVRIIEAVQPACVVAVQLAFAPTAALLAMNAPFATLVTGHPSQMPTATELYGYPYLRPSMLPASAIELAGLRDRCADVQDRFTEGFNDLMHAVNPGCKSLRNGLAAASSRLILFNYPAQLVSHRTELFPHGVFLGSSVRNERVDTTTEQWLARPRRAGESTVYFSFGTYFSVHKDVLRRVACALCEENCRVLFASGVTEPETLGPLPEHWLVRSYFPQAAVLPFCDVVICHGGNNTVTEALNSGASLVVSPFASDQFGNAVTVEQHRLGGLFDPNSGSVEEIRQAYAAAMAARDRVAVLGRKLRATNGPDLARQMCERVLIGGIQ